MEEPTFHYVTTCSFPGCQASPRFKVAAAWSYGKLRELKNYGLACESHVEALVEEAKRRREGLTLGDDEALGPVEAFELPSV